MCALVQLALLAGSVGAARGSALWDLSLKTADDDALPASTAALAARLNAARTTWLAKASSVPMTRGELRRMCGSPIPSDSRVTPAGFKAIPADRPAPLSLPPAFDARTAWPHCIDVIGHVRNQGPCGDCWAFGPTQALQDRTCIATGRNTSADLLSVEDTVACMGVLGRHSHGHPHTPSSPTP